MAAKLNKTETLILNEIKAQHGDIACIPYGKREITAIRSLEAKGLVRIDRILAGLKCAYLSAPVEGAA